MRRIISLLVIARLIQRLFNGSRGPAHRTHPGQRRSPQRPDEPPQGTAAPVPEAKASQSKQQQTSGRSDTGDN
jgi:hypothetical protein